MVSVWQPGNYRKISPRICSPARLQCETWMSQVLWGSTETLQAGWDPGSTNSSLAASSFLPVALDGGFAFGQSRG